MAWMPPLTRVLASVKPQQTKCTRYASHQKKTSQIICCLILHNTWRFLHNIWQGYNHSTTYFNYLTTLICCVIITQHIQNSYTTYQYTSTSKATSKWQWVRITLHAGFTNISLSQQNKFRLCWQQRGRRAERTNVKYDWQVSSWNTGWAQRSAD